MDAIQRISRFSGLDKCLTFGTDPSYASDIINFKVTPSGSLKLRNGLTTVFTNNLNTDGLWSGCIGDKRYLLFSCGGYLYSLFGEDGSPDNLGYIDTGKCLMFEYNGKVYIMNGNFYTVYDGEALLPTEPYIPLIAVSCTPSGEGTAFEDLNLLSDSRRVRFSADGSSVTYHLPEQNITAFTGLSINGCVSSPNDCTLSVRDGTITFPSAPATGVNNIEITYIKATSDRLRILKNTGVMRFGGQVDGSVFLWGNPDYPNYRFHSGIADGLPSCTYFPEHNFTVIGGSVITDIVSQYDRQLIFTKDRAFYSYAELKKDINGNLYASYPVYNLNNEKGNLKSNSCCVVSGEPVTLCEDGLNRWVSTTVENEKNALCFSQKIAPVIRDIIESGDFSGIGMFDRRSESEFYLTYGDNAYVFDYKNGVWYVYSGFGNSFMCEYDGVLYLACGKKIKKYDSTVYADDENGVTAVFTSPYFDACNAGCRFDVDCLSLVICYAGGGNVTASLVSPCSDSAQHGACFELDSQNGTEIRRFSCRPTIKRAGSVSLRLQVTDADADVEICSVELVSKPKGRNMRDGI